MDTRSDTTDDATIAVRIKKEPPSSSDEMKEFAETAMNELLGWYGYDAAGEDDDIVEEGDLRTRSVGDSSGPECSDSGCGPGGPWCGWCSRPMTDGAQATGAFCSELCFSQSRRASFKRNRTCDWCRHVRHTVAHVDVRDGARHLQFCGDKCLNQYKMHIFCRETRAHLELHPHALSAALSGGTTPTADTALITPDLWLRDCKDDSPPDGQVSPVQSPIQSQPDSNASGRKRHCTSRRPHGTTNKRTRTSTVTSYYNEPSAEEAQDLRVRPRSPTESAVPKPSPKVEPRPWPPAPPPVTVLVPYPVIVPVPIPLPLPIPIPIPEEILRRAVANSTNIPMKPKPAVIVTEKTETIVTDSTPVEPVVEMATSLPNVRTLRKRKRPVGKDGAGGGSGSRDHNSRRTVPA